MPAIYINAQDEDENDIPEEQDMQDCFDAFASRCHKLDLTRDAEGNFTDTRTVLAWDAFVEGWYACQGY